MNALLPETGFDCAPDTALLDLVSFKWLMAGKGWWVDVPRLRKDANYARICALRGLETGHELLGERSAELLAVLPSNEGRESFIYSNGVRL